MTSTASATSATGTTGTTRDEAMERVCMLYEQNRRRLFGLAYKLTGCRALAEECVQEGWYRACRAADTFDSACPFPNWAMQIVANICRDTLRHRRRAVILSLDQRMVSGDTGESCDDFTHVLIDTRMGPEATVLSEMFDGDLVRAMRKVNPDYVDALLACEVQGMKYETYAAAKGIPIGTAKSRANRGRIQLREKMATAARDCGYRV